MNSKRFILLILTAVATTLASLGQIVTVGTGTSTQYEAPINNWYTYSFTEMIYTADELATWQLSSSAIIKLGLPSVSGQNGTTCNVTIYLKNVTTDRFNSTTFIPVTEDDVYYSGPVTSNSPGWLTIVLDEAFTYESNSNLLVAINKTSGYYPGRSYQWYYTPTTGKYTLLHIYRDDPPLDPTTNLIGTLSTSRPNMQFTFGAPITCHKPTLHNEVETTATSAIVSWQPKTEEQQLFDLYWSTDGTTPTEETLPLATNVTGTSYTIEGLSPSTYYYVWLRGNCGTETEPDLSGGWTDPIVFHTECVAITEFPWTEDFESYPANPWDGFSSPYALDVLCWTNEVISGSLTKLFEVSTYNSSYYYGNNTKQLRLPDQSNGNRIKLCLPEMDLPGNNYLFSIDVYRNATGSSYTSEGVRVFASTDGTIDNATELGFLYRNHTRSDGGVVNAETSSGWYTYEFPIPYSGNCYIILRGESQYGSATYMDNFRVKTSPCPVPTNLVLNLDPEGVSATAMWTGIADTYDIEVNGIVTESVTSPYTIEGIELGTTYTVRVKSICSDIVSSDWSNPVSIISGLCPPLEQCELTFELTDRLGDGWNDNAIQVTDIATGIVIGTMTNENLNGTTGSSENEVNIKTLSVCDGREIQFSWIIGTWTSECSYVVYDVNGKEIFSGSDILEDPVNYTMSCAHCSKPDEAYATYITTNEVSLIWNGDNDNYSLRYKRIDDDEWTEVIISDTILVLTGLQPGAMYEYQIKGYCTDSDYWTDWTSTNTFTTGIAWNNPEVWGGQIPEPDQPVTVPENTNVVIQPGDMVSVGVITLEPGASITIEEGGELYYMNEEGIDVTMIMGGASSRGDHDGYRLIATSAYTSPDSTSISVEETGLMTNYANSDLYSFDQNFVTVEWRNYKANEFTSLEKGKGYLYYADPMFGMFSGKSMPSIVDISLPLDYNETVNLPGWNLLGNPYTCKAYPDRPFYVLNDNGDEVIFSEDNFVPPMRGFFAVADGAGQSCEMTTTAPNRDGSLSINVSQGRNRIDAASIHFGEGNDLRKIQFQPNHTKVFLTQNGRNYAVIASHDEVGELPLSFMAEHNDTYTLDFNFESIEFSYLHLIDNMTGKDVDLLDEPSYSFKAQKTDYTSRFRLVYATGNSDNPSSESGVFAFINSSGDLIIYGADLSTGTATLQVIDMMERILISETFRRSYSKHLDLPAGIYVLRLIIGNDVKVQKIVL